MPLRLALDQLANLLDSFLNQPSNGLRPLVVTTALMGTLGKAFGLFLRVESQGLNEPDAATGMPADVMCYGPAGGAGRLACAGAVARRHHVHGR